MNHHRPIIFVLVTFTIFYSLLVLGYVASLPDLRLRFLLTSAPLPKGASFQGIQIQQCLIKKIDLQNEEVEEIDYFVERPEVHDRITEIGGFSTPTFTDYVHALAKLRNLRASAQLPIGADPTEDDIAGSLGSLVEFVDKGEVIRRAIRIKFWREGWSDPHETWIVLRNFPIGPLLLSTVWFLMHLVILGVSSLAYWSRPYDKSARLFFLLSVCTANAFLGGFHWWVIASNYFLLIPFIVCGFLLPAVTLHFFWNFPVPQQALQRFPVMSRGIMYALPTIMIAGTLILIVLCFLYSENLQYVGSVSTWLEYLRQIVYGFISFSMVYFCLSVYALSRSLSISRNPVETKQITMILRAALCAIPPLVYTVYLAFFHPVEFAFGEAALPMFMVSALFLLAYTVSVVRFRMLMLDQLIERNILSYFVEYAVALLVSLGIAFVCLFGVLKGKLAPERVFSFTIFLVLVNLVMLWIRDRLQTLIHQQFSREKYQLDQAFRQIQVAPGDTLKPHVIAERMLQSCREGLKVEQAGLYLAGETEGEFQLVASYGKADFPKYCKPPQQFIDSLRHGTSLQRTNPGSRGSMTVVQRALRELDGWLVHALELNHQIVGMVVLGQKRLSEPFTAEDVAFLVSISQVTSIAVHCARYQQQISILHEELGQKSERLEDQRRQINLMQQQQLLPPPISGEIVSSVKNFHRQEIVGSSPAIMKVLNTVEKVAPSQASILIRGESGTGKELIARSIHQNGPRRDGPMVSVHCAALSPSLLESELFGHVKGAFTGANQDRLGRFAQADKGTLFLDEIGDINAETQIKLLRVLQERRFEPVGGTTTIEVDVRLITATHQNLEKLIRERKFREDLFYRLNVISIQLPPLRERREDVMQLVGYFMERAARKTGKMIQRIEPIALKALEDYPWPGNIRELENAMERAVVLAESQELLLSHFPQEIQGMLHTHQFSDSGVYLPLKKESQRSSTNNDALTDEREAKSQPQIFAKRMSYYSTVNERSSEINDDQERALLLAVLTECQGNKTKAAKKLGMPRSTYYSKLKKYETEG